MITDSARPQLAGKTRLKWDEVRKKNLLLYPEGVLVLNQTAHDILVLCDGQRTVAEILASLGRQYPGAAIDADVKTILQQLVEKNLVKIAE